MKENCDWKKCLDRIEDKGFDELETLYNINDLENGILDKIIK